MDKCYSLNKYYSQKKNFALSSRMDSYKMCKSQAQWNFRYQANQDERIKDASRMNGELDTEPLEYNN